MNLEKAREWLLDYANKVGDEVLAYNIEHTEYPNQIWREYAQRRAEQEGVTLVQAWSQKEAESVEEVRAVRLAEKLHGFARITSQGIVYYPTWAVCDDDKYPIRYAVAEPAEAFLRRHGKLTEFLEHLSEGEKELLKKLI